MVMKHKRPGPVRNQPVRLYKIIALTFLVATIILFGVIVLLSSKRATINIVTTSTPIDIKTSVMVGGSSDRAVPGQVEVLEIGTVQAFEPSGVKQENGVATGKVTITNKRDTSQSLVATTRLQTPDGVLFRLKDKVVVPANSTLEASVYADKDGVTGNIAPSTFVIPGLGADLQTQVFAASTETMTGGVKSIGVISDLDMEKAKKIILQQLIDKGRVELGNKYPGSQVLYSSSGEVFSSSHVAGTEVSRFNIMATTTIVGVFYDKTKVIEIANRLLQDKAVDENETVQPGDVDPTVSLLNYDKVTGVVELEVVYSGISTLNLRSPELAKEAFYGKNRDEVRRQLLRLDHVKSADVTFSPSWVRKIPHIEDHVTIVVKSN
jgi:hypothetical protein